MSLRVKVVPLDGSGNGSIHTPPAYFAGCIGATAEGATDEMIPKDQQVAVNGAVDVTGGTPGGTAQVYLDFSA
jgi:hypothetical protein